jgi:hypothetical protein
MAVRLSVLRADRPLPTGKFLVLVSVRGWVDPRVTVGVEGLDEFKNPMTSSEIKPVTFRLVALCLNQLCYRVRHATQSSLYNTIQKSCGVMPGDRGGHQTGPSLQSSVLKMCAYKTHHLQHTALDRQKVYTWRHDKQQTAPLSRTVFRYTDPFVLFLNFILISRL